MAVECCQNYDRLSQKYDKLSQKYDRLSQSMDKVLKDVVDLKQMISRVDTSSGLRPKMDHTKDLSKELLSQMRSCTVKLRWIHDKNKVKSYGTGFVIGNIEDIVIISSAAHLLSHVPDVEEGDNKSLEVVFDGSSKSYACYIELLIPESEILIVSCLVTNQSDCMLEFATSEEQVLTQGQRVMAMSHPSMIPWIFSRGDIIAQPYLNGVGVPAYDRNMIFFSHNLNMASGSSGAAILNTNGNVIGIHSGGFERNHRALSAGPLEKEFDRIEKANKDKDKDATVSLGNVSHKREDVEDITTRLCRVFYGVHIQYMDKVLRRRLSYLVRDDDDIVTLNELVRRHVYQNISLLS